MNLDYVYVFVRTDIPIVHQAVQATHAGIASARSGLIDCEHDHPSLVLIGIPNEDELKRVSARLNKCGFRHSMFHEDDMDGQVTAIATQSVGHEDKKHFRDYKLLV